MNDRCGGGVGTGSIRGIAVRLGLVCRGTVMRRDGGRADARGDRPRLRPGHGGGDPRSRRRRHRWGTGRASTSTRWPGWKRAACTTSSSASAISDEDWKRSSRLRASARSTMPSSSGGHSGFCSDGGATSHWRTRSTVCRSFSPLNRRRPVRISCSTMPVAKMSMRRSTSLPWVCSGAMYANLPFSVPRWVPLSSCSPPRALAMPKSSSFTAPSYDSITFEGETSRWIIPSGSPSSPVRSWA